MILFKGAGPGTHWHVNDPRSTGFTTSSGAFPDNRDSAIRHILSYSYPSPYISFSHSYAIALTYALTGPSGIATPVNPGYVYEVDTSLASVMIIDPVAKVARKFHSHEHDGEQDLIFGILDRSSFPGAITSPPHRRPTSPPKPPFVPNSLEAIIFACRDAEVFVSSMPAACVVNRYPVF